MPIKGSPQRVSSRSLRPQAPLTRAPLRGRHAFALGALLMTMLACNMQRATASDLPATITAQALTIEARARTAAAPTESPAATDAPSTPTQDSLPATSGPAATNPPQPTTTPKTPKPTKTPQPTSTATPAAPIAPEISLVESLSCTAITLNEGPGWIQELKIYWTDNSSDEDYFMLWYGAKFVSAPPPNTTTFTWRHSYLHGSLPPENQRAFYMAAHSATGTSLLDAYSAVSPCTQPY